MKAGGLEPSTSSPTRVLMSIRLRDVAVAGAFLAATQLGACDQASRDARSNEVQLEGETQVHNTPLSSPPANSTDTVKTARGCGPPDTVRTSIRGVARQEVFPGPPGYGETPSLDSPDTVVVLTLRTAIRFCVEGPYRNAASEVQTLRKVQLAWNPRLLSEVVGEEVTVFGRPFAAVFGWHHTPVLIRVDSIQGGRGRAGPIA